MPAAASFRRPIAAATLGAALALAPGRSARAEGSATYKYQDYAEDGGRIQVQAQYGLLEQTLGPDARLSLMGVIDTITGATPTGEPAESPGGEVPLTEIDDVRKAWTLDASRQFGRVNLAAGLSNSRESDYVSTGLSLNTLTDFRDKNTTLLLGVAGTQDDVKVFFQSEREEKETWDVIAGVTQLLSPRATATLNVSFGRATGYLSDPYKIIQKNVELLPGIFLPLTFNENRPRTREKWTVFASLNQAFRDGATTLEGSYRFYDDTFGITSHTATLALFQKLGSRVVVSPSIRYYQQGAADFYHVTLDGTDIEPRDDGMPVPDGPFFSADYRLAKLRTWTLGLKVVCNLTDRLSLDAAYERYLMEGRDSVTSPDAFPDADIITGGVRFSW